MNIKKYLLPLGLALVTTWAIQYFVIDRYWGGGNASSSGEVKSGQSFTAPASAVEAKPLNREVNFAEAVVSAAPVITQIKTTHALYEFSTEGASLEQLTFTRSKEEGVIHLSTLPALRKVERERRCFLVALNKYTPYMYQLVDQKTTDQYTQLVYKAHSTIATVQKIYTVYHEKFQIDMALTVTPASEQVVQARILYPAPYLTDATNPAERAIKDDVVNAVFNDEKDSIHKEARGKIDINKGWFAPTFFGSDDRYFVHALIRDDSHFAQRAYYSLEGKVGLTSILEGPDIKEPTSWNISFYFGPKEEEVMRAVDPRLESTLDYSGILAPISRLLLEILKFLYTYVHNYGWAIVLLTLLINLILLPLNIKSNRSMKQSAELQKKLAYLKQKYKDQPDIFAREQTELLGKDGMSMIGGCLPKLLQLPIFFALSRVLSSSIELYKAPFVFWIHDLSARDPYYVLPVIIALCMILQPTTADIKQRFTMIAMALFFGAVSANFSAGLCLYIFIGLILNGMQGWAQNKFNWA